MMQSNPKLQLMLGAVILLSAVKFALLPLLQWQNETLEQIASIETRNAKAQKLLADKDAMMAELTQLGTKYNNLAQSIPVYPDSASFRLETQMMFEQVLKMEHFRPKQFYWREDTDTQLFGNFYSASFNVNFLGGAKDFALLQSKLAYNYPEYRILNMSNSLSGFKADSLGRADVSLTVEAYYWKGGVN